MKIYFTIGDIKEFLNEQGLSWSGTIYNERKGERIATIKDFENTKFDTFKIEAANKNNKLTEVEVVINNFAFIIYNGSPAKVEIRKADKKDFSKEWVSFLLNKHEDDYGKVLHEYVKRNKKRIEEAKEQRLLEFKKNLDKEYEKEIDLFNELGNKAIKSLPKNNSVEI